MSSELWQYSATELAKMIRSKDVTSEEVVEDHLKRIEEVNPKLNAVIHCYLEEARQAASQPDLPDGPLRGVPFLMKDIGGEEAGREQSARSDHVSRVEKASTKTGQLELGDHRLAQPVLQGVEELRELAEGKGDGVGFQIKLHPQSHTN